MNGWEWIGRASDVLGVLTFFFAGVLFLRAAVELWGYRRRRRTSTTERPVALAVGLPNDVSGAVRTWMETSGTTMDLESWSCPWIKTEADFLSAISQLCRVKHRLTQKGVTEVHLFYKGPVTLATAVGALFDNWVPVKAYEYVEGSYQFVAVLEKGTIKGMYDDEVRRAAQDALTGTLEPR